jgi:putative ABC transport system permease protein
MAISIRERTGELAILKAIGFKNGSILMLVLAEALAIALIGGLVGLGLALVAIPILGNALNGMLPNLILSKSVLGTGLGVALLVGAISGLLPGIGAMRLRVVEAFRKI